MRRIVYIIFIFLFYIPFTSVADAYPEVVFDNSLGAGSYAKSSVKYSGDSWVENVNGQLLVSDTLFFTPSNSLSLKYISSDKGHWSAKISYNRLKNHYRFNHSDQLSFFIYIKTKDTKLQDLPKVNINFIGGASASISLEKYISNYQVGTWIQVKIPCTAFNGIGEESLISGIGFIQHKSSKNEHNVFLDQIEFLPQKYAQVRLNSPAILTDAIPYDKMVHLKWQLPLSPSIRYVKLYRSTDGKTFDPVGMRPVFMQSCLDVVPKTGEKYYYKIVWVDYNYKESPASAVKESVTKPLSDSAIVELIQGAHINYFVENFDVNSGMYMPYRSKDKALVSTKETAGAILSLIVGAEKKQVPRNVVLQRVSKIAYFLQKAQNRHGIFPAYFDGRKGLPEYKRGSAHYDVQATASLIEALLIAREYFDGNEDVERDLRNRITALYDQINWQAIANESLLLKPKIGHMDDEGNLSASLIEPISGANDGINAYLLALSSKRFALPKESYYEGVYNKFGVDRIESIEEFGLDIYADSMLIRDDSDYLITVSFTDTLLKKPLLNPVYKYGVELPLGEHSGSLMDLYKPFMTINPTTFNDSIVDWNNVLQSYIKYIKRRDNEFGVGATNSNIWGFYQHRDSIGNYRINPAIGPSAIISEPEIGRAALLTLYREFGDFLFTEYGFRSWLDLRNSDESDEYLATNQSAIVVMLENAKSGLIWKLYDKIPELKKGREKLISKSVLEVE